MLTVLHFVRMPRWPEKDPAAAETLHETEEFPDAQAMGAPLQRAPTLSAAMEPPFMAQILERTTVLCQRNAAEHTRAPGRPLTVPVSLLNS